MSRVTTNAVGKWVAGGMVAVLIGSLAIWFLGRERLPRTIGIAAGEEGGLYYRFGEQLRNSLQQRTGRSVELDSTAGSVDNVRLLQEEQVDLAIVQGGSVPLDKLSIVAPLYPELVLVIVRRESNIETIADLAGKSVALGKEGSGMRKSALNVLAHFGIDPAPLKKNGLYFKRLLDDPQLDAAIVTTGIENRDLHQVLESGDFKLLPIKDAAAIEMRDPYLRWMPVPRGLFSEQPAVPAEEIDTLATTSFLVCRGDTPDRLVEAALASIHEENLRLKIPTLIPRNEAQSHSPTRLHPVAHRYFNPSDQIGLLANVMESLAAGKELLFALGAGIYLLWHRWRRLKEREIAEAISQQKERLDAFLEETLRIESDQMQTSDVERLQKFLDEVTRIKLEALREFTEEELRADRAFSIFLAQCANLISKIQMKIVARTSQPAGDSGE